MLSLHSFQIITCTTLHYSTIQSHPLHRLLAAPTLVVVLVRRDRPLRLSRDSSTINRSKAIEANSVLSNSRSNSLGVPLESIQRQVRNVIALLVVVDVVRNTHLATKEFKLLLRLDDLSASEETTRSDPAIQETGVIAAAAEVRRDGVEAVGREEVLEEDFRLGAAGGAGLVVGASVAVVDSENVVGRGDHVEVEVQADRGGLFGGEVLGVVVAAQQAEFFAGPEAEADGVVDRVAGELLGDFEDADNATAVVVDTGSSEDRV
jgi:hypothetical protein